MRLLVHWATLPAACFGFLMAGTSLAVAVELPSRKPGFWEIRMKGDSTGPDGSTVRACIDAASDKAMLDSGNALVQSFCDRKDIKKNGDTYSWDSTCSIGPIKSTSHTEASGDFQSSYTMKVTGDVGGVPGFGNGKTEMNQTAKWVSEKCADGFKPGDMEMPGGMKINVNDATNMLKGFGR